MRRQSGPWTFQCRRTTDSEVLPDRIPHLWNARAIDAASPRIHRGSARARLHRRSQHRHRAALRRWDAQPSAGTLRPRSAITCGRDRDGQQSNRRCRKARDDDDSDRHDRYARSGRYRARRQSGATGWKHHRAMRRCERRNVRQIPQPSHGGHPRALALGCFSRSGTRILSSRLQHEG